MTESPRLNRPAYDFVAFFSADHTVPGVRSHCRFRSRGTEYVRESGMKWMSGGAKRQCGRAQTVPIGRRSPRLLHGRLA
jgi:hypothetical protein